MYTCIHTIKSLYVAKLLIEASTYTWENIYKNLTIKKTLHWQQHNLFFSFRYLFKTSLLSLLKLLLLLIFCFLYILYTKVYFKKLFLFFIFFLKRVGLFFLLNAWHIFVFMLTLPLGTPKILLKLFLYLHSIPEGHCHGISYLGKINQIEFKW